MNSRGKHANIHLQKLVFISQEKNNICDYFFNGIIDAFIIKALI